MKKQAQDAPVPSRRRVWAVIALLVTGAALALWAIRDPLHSSHRSPAVFAVIPADESAGSDLLTACGGRDLLLALFEGLTVLESETLSVQPGAASRWTVSKDCRGYVFHLREGACWSDGEPVCAADFATAWVQRGLAVWDPTRYSPHAIRVMTPNDERLVVSLPEPEPDFLFACALAPYLPVPSHLSPGLPSAANLADEWTFNGPFVASGLEGNRLILEKNTAYSGEYPAVAEQLELLICRNPEQAYQSFIRNGLLWSPAVPDYRIHRVQHRPDFRRTASATLVCALLNARRPPLDDPKVREALHLSLVRGELAEALPGKRFWAANRMVPPALDPSMRPRFLPDPARAPDALAEAGFTEGKHFPELTLLHEQEADLEQLARTCLETWRARLGIHVRREVLSAARLRKRLETGNFDLVLLGVSARNPSARAFLLGRIGAELLPRTGWTDPRFPLLRNALTTPDPTDRLLEEMETLLLQRGPSILPLLFEERIELISRRLSGYRPNRTGLRFLRDLSVGR